MDNLFVSQVISFGRPIGHKVSFSPIEAETSSVLIQPQNFYSTTTEEIITTNVVSETILTKDTKSDFLLFSAHVETWENIIHSKVLSLTFLNAVCQLMMSDCSKTEHVLTVKTFLPSKHRKHGVECNGSSKNPRNAQDCFFFQRCFQNW